MQKLWTKQILSSSHLQQGTILGSPYLDFRSRSYHYKSKGFHANLFLSANFKLIAFTTYNNNIDPWIKLQFFSQF